MAAGLFTGILAACLFKVSIFMTGAIAGMIIGQLIWMLIGLILDMSKYSKKTTNIIHISLIIFFGLLIGILTLKYMIKAITSFIGTNMIVMGIGFYIQKYGEKDLEKYKFLDTIDQCDATCWALIGVWVVLFMIGVTYQYKWYQCCYNKNDKKRNSKHQQVDSSEVLI